MFNKILRKQNEVEDGQEKALEKTIRQDFTWKVKALEQLQFTAIGVSYVQLEDPSNNIKKETLWNKQLENGTVSTYVEYLITLLIPNMSKYDFLISISQQD